MRTGVKYPMLEREIFERGIKKSAIAKTIQTTEKTLRNKLAGESKFTWEEACEIQRVHFPDRTKDYLFEHH